MKIIPSIFVKRNEEGDFDWMIHQKEYNHILFIFNDNVEDHNTSYLGGGNAIIRQYNQYSDLMIPRSAGIPTGNYMGGFKRLTENVQWYIDEAILEIKDIIEEYNYDTVMYSSLKTEDKNGHMKLGSGIFNISDDVKEYIVKELYNLERLENS